MNYSIEDLLQQAKEYSKSTPLIYKKEESYIYKGYKICKIENQIVLYNTFTDKLSYNLLSKEECSLLFYNGFVRGVHMLSKIRYQNKIEDLNNKIRNEINGRNNKKHYNKLRIRRENLINKYSQIANN